MKQNQGRLVNFDSFNPFGLKKGKPKLCKFMGMHMHAHTRCIYLNAEAIGEMGNVSLRVECRLLAGVQDFKGSDL